MREGARTAVDASISMPDAAYPRRIGFDKRGTEIFNFNREENHMTASRQCQITKTDGVYTAPRIEVVPGDSVTWEMSDHTEFTVWFHPGRCPLAGECMLNSVGGSLDAKLRPDAEKGVYEYTIHCHGNSLLARGGSPPTMIVI